MSQGRGSQRGVANVLTCGVMLLFVALGFAAGCSSGDVTDPESLGKASEGIDLCGGCPKPTGCVSWTCVKATCVETAAADGATCLDPGGEFKGRCLDGLCCPGCVVRNLRTGSACAPKEGTEP